MPQTSNPVTRRTLGNTATAVAFWLAALPLCRAQPVQSAVHPASREAARIADLWWLLFWTGTAVFVITCALFFVGIFLRRSENPAKSWFGNTRFVIVSGILIPSVILIYILFATLNTTLALRPGKSDLTIQVIGYQYWWEVRYPDQNIVTANELHIPAGQPVRLQLTSADVNHSFWVPRLHGKMDLIPGRINDFWIAAEKPGVYRGQCAEYCGLQHAHMAFYVVAMEPDAFRAWVAERQNPDVTPSTAVQRIGWNTFFQAGCQQCHTLGRTQAKHKIGPDLTHIGSRLSLGAVTLPNTPGNLEGWISNPQAVKPGNKMPRQYLKPEELHALRNYLMSLK